MFTLSLLARRGPISRLPDTTDRQAKEKCLVKVNVEDINYGVFLCCVIMLLTRITFSTVGDIIQKVARWKAHPKPLALGP